MAFTSSDGWLLGAVAGSFRWCGLRDLIAKADWLNTSIPTFDMVSFGIPRLVAAKYVETRGTGSGIKFRATKSGRRLVKEAERGARSRGAFLGNMWVAIGPSTLGLDAEDRSLGRLDGLDIATFDLAVHEWLDKPL